VNISIKLSGSWTLVMATITVGILVGAVIRGFGGMVGIFVLLLLSAIAVGVAQQTLP
jgi:hypothetical protein